MALDKRIDSTRIHAYPSGAWLDPLNLRPEDVHIEDIVTHLGNQARWSGGTSEFFSVAQHVVLCSRLVPEEDAWEGLHHDDPEYILQDMAKPLKNDPRFGQAYRGAERRVEVVIAEVFGLRYPFPPSVKEVDVRLLVTEARDLKHGTEDWGYYDDIEPYDFTIKPWSPKRSRNEFMKRYEELVSIRS